MPKPDDYKGPDPDRIRAMFSSIAGRYDRANTILSGGIHHAWRRRTVRWSDARAGHRVLDCATGTGDLAIAFKRAVGARGDVVGTDFVPEMLELARRKTNDIRFEQADVTALPYENAAFDIASIGFGIRNVGDPARGIAELARVVKPGGRVMILEFGQPRSRIWGALYKWYCRLVVPRVGGVITGKRDAYEYLEHSAAAFPSGEDFARLMRASANFRSVEHQPLTFGVAYLYKGVVA